MKQARGVVHIFRGKAALYNALLLYTLAKGNNEGMTRRQIHREMDIDPQKHPIDLSTVNRRLNILETLLYVARSEESKPKRDKGDLYLLTPLGILACSFLDLEDQTLGKMLMKMPTGPVPDTWKQIWSAAMYSSLPLKIRLQVEYVMSYEPIYYLNSPLGKHFLKILKKVGPGISQALVAGMGYWEIPPGE